ncbi:MAG: tetratricopeptide repeat protein [Verrucomicrobiota bacterium]
MSRPIRRKPAARQADPRASGLHTDYVLIGWKVTAAQVLLIVAVALWIYYPAFNGDWLWDDDIYVTNNTHITEPGGLWKIWFEPSSFLEYYPIKQTVAWAEWRLWGADTLGYHLVNVALLVAGALLIWRLFARLGVRLAWLGGLVFVAHPLNVESVAWMAELKNTLSLPPFLLAACAWIDFEEGGRRGDYLRALAWFVVALLCKISVVLFPAVLPLYAWWKRGRVDVPGLLATAPFWAVSAMVTWIDLHAGSSFNQAQALGVSDVLAMGDASHRFALAGTALAFYFASFWLPLAPVPIYPLWPLDPLSAVDFLPWLGLAVMLGWCWWRRAAWGRHALLGLGFFLVMSLPFVAFGVTFFPRDTWVMDHFLYVPMIGLVGLAVAAFGSIDAQLPVKARTYSTALATIVLVLMAFEAHAYAGAFSDAATLWTYTLQRNPGAWTAHIGLGNELLKANHLPEAEREFEAALALRPNNAAANDGLGTALGQEGRVPEAIARFRAGLAINPNDATTHTNLGIILAATGHGDEALGEFLAALKLQPNFAQAHYNVGNVYFQRGQLAQAAEAYRAAIALRPHYSTARFNLARVAAAQGNDAEALEQWAGAVKDDPDFVEARLQLGAALAKAGRNAEAADQFEHVLAIDPANATARDGLARLGGAK